MGLRADWVSAKKQSAAQFKQAYAAWSKAVMQRIEQGETDPKYRKVVIEQSLEQAGIGGGTSFDSVVNFKQDLGPALDKYEKARKPYDDFMALQPSKQFEMMLKDSKLSKAFGGHCKKEHSEENWLYFTKGYKLKPEKIYAEYIDDNAGSQLNLTGVRRKAWDDWKNKGKGNPKKLAEDTRGDIEKILLNDTFTRFTRSPEVKQTLGLVKAQQAGEQIKKVCVAYFRQLQALQKRWKGAKLQPEFWTPTMTVLNDIVKELNGKK